MFSLDKYKKHLNTKYNIYDKQISDYNYNNDFHYSPLVDKTVRMTKSNFKHENKISGSSNSVGRINPYSNFNSNRITTKYELPMIK